MKPTFLSSLLTASFLASPAAYASSFDGAYVGAQAGYENFSVDDDFTGAGVLAGTNASDSFSASGANGGLYVGYGKRFDTVYLGVEAEGSLGSADYSQTGGGLSTKVEHKNTYGASIRAGFLPTDTILLYGRVGVVRSSFDSTVDAPSVPFTAKDSTSLNGLRFGLGAETLLSEHITARLDWAYTNYQDYELTYVASGASVGTEKLSPTSNTFRLGLAYNF